ncbi:hypothetical protein SAMN04487894_12214 [Niabella drilacis]|uniref:Uncharacterized protein n=2 Tax=Niabella drilacis (strain DSM 25811 / CCM 8410 / CCUG 62505 / LMG 26954 / E90) TaxID=1285928 RepID=A0A1G7A9U0_NIADE|nr:hypothetical protein SAMN04487894_12214 [Niabella drilacis]
MITNLVNPNESPNRRRIFSRQEALFDLHQNSDVLKHLFSSFDEAVELFNEEARMTPVLARGRNFNANLMQAKFNQCILGTLPNNWKVGSYKRFLVIKGPYLILFKKLNPKGMPMGIKTASFTNLVQQTFTPLFNSDEHSTGVLFFGYQENRFGIVVRSELLCIDSGDVAWRIFKEDIGLDHGNLGITPVVPIAPIEPDIFESIKLKPQQKRANTL